MTATGNQTRSLWNDPNSGSDRHSDSDSNYNGTAGPKRTSLFASVPLDSIAPVRRNVRPRLKHNLLDSSSSSNSISSAGAEEEEEEESEVELDITAATSPRPSQQNDFSSPELRYGDAY
jgi:hypothetical protein